MELVFVHCVNLFIFIFYFSSMQCDKGCVIIIKPLSPLFSSCKTSFKNLFVCVSPLVCPNSILDANGLTKHTQENHSTANKQEMLQFLHQCTSNCDFVMTLQI